MGVDIKQVARGVLEEVFSKGNLDYLDRNCDPAYRVHDPLTGDRDLSGLKKDVESYRAAFPDLKATIVGICCEGDTVCTLWRCTGTFEKPFMGVQPTGKKMTVEGIGFDRFRNGKLLESYVQWDTLKFLQGLGVIPRIDFGAQAGGPAAQPRI